MQEELFQYMLSTLIPAISQYSHLNFALTELTSLDHLSLDRLQLLESELQGLINLPKEVMDKKSHLLWSRKALSALESEPFTVESSETFIHNLANLHQDLENLLDLSSTLTTYMSCVMSAISNSSNIEEVCVYARGLKYIKENVNSTIADSTIDWVQVQIKTLLWDKLNSHDDLSSIFDSLQQIDALGLGNYNEDIKELVGHIATLQIEEKPELFIDLYWKIQKLSITDPSLISQINTWKNKYIELGYDFQSEMSTINPPQSLEDENIVQSKEELIIDPRALYARGEGKPKVFIYKGSLRSNPAVKVAIKEYVIDGEDEIKPYMIQEAKVLEKCSGYPACLKFYGTYMVAENSENVFGIVMELCNNSLMEEISLRKEERSPYTEDELKEITITLLEGFHNLHINSIFHRDIKPHNLLISMNKKLKIADFNISELSNYSILTMAARTDIRSIQGTDGYMAPEVQAQFNKKLADRSAENTADINPAKTDVYGLGLTFLQIWTLESVQGLNLAENQEVLKEIIGRIQPAWFKDMLNEMLTFESSDRSGKIIYFASFVPSARSFVCTD